MPDTREDPVVDALHIDAKEPVEILLRGAFHCAHVRNTRVIHQDTDTLFGKDSAENLPNLQLVRNIARVRCCLPTRIGDLLGRGFSLLEIDIRDANRSPVCRESKSNRLPDAAAPPVTMATLPSSLKSFVPLPVLFRVRFPFSTG